MKETRTTLSRTFCFATFAWCLSSSNLTGQQVVAESFTTLSNWTVGTKSGSFTPSITSDNWLRLTNTGSQEATYAYYNTAFASSNTSVYADFLFRFYGGTSVDGKKGDGITFFLYDATQTFNAGFYGGSLGYANYNGGTGSMSSYTTPGMAGGYLGIGIDQFGNYSNSWDEVSNARNGGPGVIPSSIAVRGPGSGQTGYEYLGGTSSLSSPLFTSSTTAPTSGDGYGHMIISISPTNQLTVSLARDNTTTPTTILTMDLSSYTRPENLRFGFTASTGGATSYHDIGELTFASVPAHRWDNGTGTSNWNNGSNWNPDTTPIPQADVLLDNTHVSTAQTINVGTDAARQIRTLYIDAPFSYTLNNGTLNFNGGSSVSTSGIIASASNGASSAGHVVNSAITMANAIEVRNNAGVSLTLGGAISNNGNTITLAGNSDININGVISGAGGLLKTGVNNATLSGANTYTGVTQINEGTLTLGGSNKISDSSTLNVAGGTLNLAGNSERVGNLTFSNNGAIDYGAAGTANYFLFNNITGSPSGVITINNWEQARDILAAQSTLSSTVLNQFYFSGYGTGATQGTTGATVGDYGGGWLILNPVASTWSIWDGSSSNAWGYSSYGQYSNWQDNALPASGAKVVFGTTTAGNRNVALGANRTVNAIRFDANGSGSYNIGNGSNAYTLTMGGSGTAFIQQKSSTYDQTISAPVALANNTVVDMIGSKNLTISGALSSTGNLVKEGTGGKLILSGDNSNYSGNIYVNAGTLQAGNSNALGNTTGKTSVSGGATLEVTGNISTAESLDLSGTGYNGAGALNNLSGNNTVSGTINLADNATINAAAGTLTLSGAVVSDAGHKLTVAGAGNVTANGTIATGSGGVQMDGTGTLTLSGNNSFRGGLDINSGTVTLGAANRINDNVAVNISGGTFNLASNNETVGSLAGTGGTVTLGSANFTAGGDNASTSYAGTITGTSGSFTKTGTGTLTLSGANTYTGATTISAGTLALGASNVLSDSTAVTLQSGATFAVGSNSDTIAKFSGTGGTISIASGGTLTAGDATSTSYSGALTGSGTLVKQGSGTLTIASNVNFDGTVVVNAGSLSLTAGATIANLELKNGTTLYLGGAGTNYNIGSLTITGTTTIDFGTGSVTLDVNKLTTNGSATINISNWTNLQDAFYATTWVKDGVTYSYDSPPSLGQTPLNTVTFVGYPSSYKTSWDPFPQYGHGKISPIPEPSTYGAILSGAAMGLAFLGKLFRSRRSKKNSKQVS